MLGVILFLWALIPLEGINLSFIEAMSVGATLSATDPVTILAIFNTYKVDPSLYTVIFGESILNDAIAIVLFETAQKYKNSSTSGNFTIFTFFESIGTFLAVFFGSLFFGIIVGVATSLLLKFTLVRRFPKIESCLVFLIAYSSYFFSNAIHMSGQSFPSILLMKTLKLTNTRHCLIAVLWNLSQTLRTSQHVQEDATEHQIHLPDPCSACREFHFHLPWTFTLNPNRPRIQTIVHPCYRGRDMRGQMVCRVPTFCCH